MSRLLYIASTLEEGSRSLLIRIVIFLTSSNLFLKDVQGPLPGFSTFNHYLTFTHLTDEINRRQTITVLTIDNGAMNGLLDKHLTFPTLKNTPPCLVAGAIKAPPFGARGRLFFQKFRLVLEIIFINTCAIRENAEEKVWQRLHYFWFLKRHWKSNVAIGRTGSLCPPKVVVLGCMAERLKEKILDSDKMVDALHVIDEMLERDSDFPPDYFTGEVVFGMLGK
ncbi:hypothetical protein V8G54_015919 [Vigna mungo]|uniref:MTTase N-terminal domain-containing protein n=1 Tax=Vigna mungo TaxID=3915 RepID=A0AAQ3S0V9_VIGMU